MLQVKMFRENPYTGIEKKANEWLKEAGDKIEIISIAQSSFQGADLLTFLYKIKE